MLFEILAAYGISSDESTILPFGAGLINNTWKISNNGKEYILQCINHHVFRQPVFIAENLDLLSSYLNRRFPGYLFVKPIPALDQSGMVYNPQYGYFRLFPFVSDSYTYEVVPASSLAFEAARQFGRFTRLLSGFPAETLNITLPDFHNLSLRYRQFEAALSEGDAGRIEEAREPIDLIGRYKYILDQFEDIKHHPGFKTRVTHHDTKISNVLFDRNGDGLCVIDLDTVMPGYFISDLGDMMRTYLSPVSEEEKDLSLISIREDYFKAIVSGYLGEMKTELSADEIAHAVYAGKFMIYMQALRFLTDHINRDVYYGAKYDGHNLVRARNQLTLLERLTEKESALNRIVLNYIDGLE
ncbi:MAG: aminoglycoside phosphotransferase family protein [Puia sp.]|nr:aminoglycoside phosphotransferase family protein [Puia sp.]